MRRALAAALLFAAPAMAQEAWVAKTSADLVLLDKIRGQPTNISVKTGDTTNFGSLTIKVRSCLVRPPDQPADATAYVDVTDARGRGDIFHGWILVNTPSVSQVEHPVYDLKLLGCK